MYIIKKKNRVILFYLLSLIILAIGFFTNPYHHDEGLIAITLTNYISNGEFNFAINNETPLSFTRPYFYLLSLLTDNFLSPFSYFILRIPNLIISFLSIILLYKIICHINERKKYFFYPSYIIFIYYILTFSGGLTLRTDIIVFSIILVTILCYLKYNDTENESYLIFSFLFCSMMVAIHHLMVFPFLISLHIIIKNIKKFSVLKFIYLIILILVLSPISFYLLLWGDSIVIFFNNLFEANNDLNGSLLKNFYDEFLNLFRLKHLIYYHAKFAIVLLSAMIVIICSLIIKILINNKEYIDLYYYMIFGVFFLASIPDKWLHHYAIIFPFIIFLLIDSLRIINSLQNKILEKIKKFFKIFIILYSIVIVLFMLVDVWRNIYYNNYVQKFFNENKNLRIFGTLINDEISNSNDSLSKINKHVKNKYILMEPSIFPFLNNSKFSTRSIYANEINADYKFINKFTQKKCKDSDLYQKPNDLMEAADIMTNEISFYRYKYIICKIKK